MAVAFPGESPEYRAAQSWLLEQEIELRRAMEAVAAARRRLPPCGVVPEDYLFQAQGHDGVPVQVRLSELFSPGKNSLVIYSMMFPRAADDMNPGPPGGQTALLPLTEGPCPSCTALLDQLDGAAEHVSQHVNLAVAAKAPPERMLHLRRRTRLAAAAPAVLGRHHLQPRLPGRDRRRLAATHAERVPPRRGHDPPLLGLRTLLRTRRSRAGTPPRRHHRAALEPVRLHPGGPPSQLARAVQLLTTLRRPGRGSPCIKRSGVTLRLRLCHVS